MLVLNPLAICGSATLTMVVSIITIKKPRHRAISRMVSAPDLDTRFILIEGYLRRECNALPG
jgi:hypothetical protein